MPAPILATLIAAADRLILDSHEAICVLGLRARILLQHNSLVSQQATPEQCF